MICKDCIHYDMCDGFIPSDLDKDVFDYCREGRTDEIPDIEERCTSFKDKSRYIELPCKVGDRVYIDEDAWHWGLALYYDNRFIHSKYFVVGEIVSIIKTKKQLLIKIRVSNSIHSRYRHKRYPVSALGKTVFLTKEEAEKALKGKRG